MSGKRAGDGTAISWTHLPGYKGVTWNPTVGCTRVSAGCDHCYAFSLHDNRYAENLRVARVHGYQTTAAVRADEKKLLSHEKSYLPWPAQYDRPFSQVQVMDERITQPLHWAKPRAVFVDSMADLFHDDVPDEVLDRIFAVMALTPQHVYMILTKRPERMRAYVASRGPGGEPHRMGYYMGEARPELAERFEIAWPLPNVWLGTSVEHQDAALTRIPWLLDTPAAVRFLSCEPLLGPLALRNLNVEAMAQMYDLALPIGMYYINALTGRNDDMGRPCPDVPAIDWVICGGESGPGFRPMDERWAADLRAQCLDARVPFFYKQTSAYRSGQPGPADLDASKGFPTHGWNRPA